MGKASSLSTKKRLRQSKKRQLRNKGNKTRLKTELKLLRGTAETESTEARKMLPRSYSIIDKAVRKGVLNKNAAARQKSRLTKLVTKD